MKPEQLVKYFKQHLDKIYLAMWQFTLIECIGQGGNGLVYEANLLGEVVAIKFLLIEGNGQTKNKKLKRFLAEYFNVIMLENLQGIVRYIDFDLLKIKEESIELEVPVIIMKKYNCSLLENQKTKSKEEFLNLFNFLLEVVEKIHTAGIIHRDLKPENILYDGFNFVLADFGIANYNPEIFKIKAVTEKKERLGNRLFSAPEQEKSGIKPANTMDIYSIGQILHWYVTGTIHRGTGRNDISEIFNGCEIEDRVIHKCLANDPKKRFQTISEIKDFIKKEQSLRKEINIWDYLELFDLICRRNFPKYDYHFAYCKDVNRIDKLLNDLMTNLSKFDRQLWWHKGMGNNHLSLLHLGEGKWRIVAYEYKILEIWIHNDGNVFNNFILVHYGADDPFIVGSNHLFNTVLVDDHYHVSYSEYQNGFAEINGEVVELSKHKVELITREEKEGYFFIGTKYDCILQPRNDEAVIEFLSKIGKNSKLISKKLYSFALKIRMNKHDKVAMEM